MVARPVNTKYNLNLWNTINAVIAVVANLLPSITLSMENLRTMAHTNARHAKPTSKRDAKNVLKTFIRTAKIKFTTSRI